MRVEGLIGFVKQWARTIAAVALMAGIVDMVLPAGSSKRTVRLVTGTMLLFVIAAPLVARVSGMQAVGDWSTSTLLSSSRTGSDAGMVAAGQLAAQIEVLLQQLPGVVDARVVVTMAPGSEFQVGSVRAEVTARDEQTMINPINVVIGEQEIAGYEDLQAELCTAISLVTGLDSSEIDVVVTGGR